MQPQFNAAWMPVKVSNVLFIVIAFYSLPTKTAPYSSENMFDHDLFYVRISLLGALVSHGTEREMQSLSITIFYAK